MLKNILGAVLLIMVMASSLFAANSSSCDDYRNNKCYYDGDTSADYAYEFGKKSTSPFYDFKDLGGDCTNFASQAILAGMTGITEPSDLKPKRYSYLADQNYNNLAWYYKTSNNRGSAWTGADWMFKYAKSNKNSYKGLHFDFITKDSSTVALKINLVKKGDIIFADWENDGVIDHTMIVTQKYSCNSYSCVKVAYHNSAGNSMQKNRSLSSINSQYNYNAIFHIYRPTFYSDYGL